MREFYLEHEPKLVNSVLGVSGFEGIKKENLLVFIATGDNFVDRGITDGSYVYCEKGSNYKEGDLIIVLNKKEEMKVVTKLTKGMTYFGKIVLSLRVIKWGE